MFLQKTHLKKNCMYSRSKSIPRSRQLSVIKIYQLIKTEDGFSRCDFMYRTISIRFRSAYTLPARGRELFTIPMINWFRFTNTQTITFQLSPRRTTIKQTDGCTGVKGSIVQEVNGLMKISSSPTRSREISMGLHVFTS